jgi:hypothetical protein
MSRTVCNKDVKHSDCYGGAKEEKGMLFVPLRERACGFVCSMKFTHFLFYNIDFCVLLDSFMFVILSAFSADKIKMLRTKYKLRDNLSGKEWFVYYSAR